MAPSSNLLCSTDKRTWLSAGCVDTFAAVQETTKLHGSSLSLGCDMSEASDSTSENQLLVGQRVALVGRFTGMSRGDARGHILAQGGQVVEGEQAQPTLIVIGDDKIDLQQALSSDKSSPASWADEVSQGRAELIKESQLWERLRLVDQTQGVQQLYTPAMLAELVDVPITAIRRWHRDSHLQACRHVQRLPYFDFSEVAIARHLAALFHAGYSLRVIDRKLAELAKMLPDVPRPLADPAVVVEGRQLLLRRGEELAEPGGQLLIDFDKVEEEAEEQPNLLQLDAATPLPAEPEEEQPPSILDDLLQSAQQWEDEGELDKAVEAYRTLLVAGQQSPELQFALADLLYRMGDLAAARERYYVAIELDEEYVEARANLGCVLVENNELDLARASFEGALAFHPDYADVHYHLASLLDRLDDTQQADVHWHSFLQLAPESPWADIAQRRVEAVESK